MYPAGELRCPTTALVMIVITPFIKLLNLSWIKNFVFEAYGAFKKIFMYI